MNNLKKFFAFSIATAMVAGAVWGITPALKLSAYNEQSKFNWDAEKEAYVEADNGEYSYTEVKESGKPIVEKSEGNSGDSGSGNTGGGSGDSGKTPGEGGTSGNTPSAVDSVKIYGSKYVYLPNHYPFSVYISYSDDRENDNNVTWTCENTEIATVDKESGLVTPIKVGKATITATSKLDSSKSDSFEFTVVPEPEELSFKDVDPEKGLTIKVGDTIELVAKGTEKYSPESYRYHWDVYSGSDESQKEIATVTKDGKITGKAEGQGEVIFEIVQFAEYSEPLTVAYASCKLEVVSADTKETTTEVASSTPTNADPRGITSHDDVVVTPAVVANYQKWLSTFGGGTAEGTQAVSGTAGQPGSEVVVADPKTGQSLHMFQSTDNSNTLLAAPESIVPSGTKITTLEAAADTPAFKAVQNKIARVSRRGSVQKVYGIAATATDGTLITTLNGKAAMSVPIPADINVPAGRTLVVYFIPNEGETIKLETVIDQGRVVFGTPGFGTFAFVVE